LRYTWYGVVSQSTDNQTWRQTSRSESERAFQAWPAMIASSVTPSPRSRLTVWSVVNRR
jgi:hypothetical protein